MTSWINYSIFSTKKLVLWKLHFAKIFNALSWNSNSSEIDLFSLSFLTFRNFYIVKLYSKKMFRKYVPNMCCFNPFLPRLDDRPLKEIWNWLWLKTSRKQICWDLLLWLKKFGHHPQYFGPPLFYWCPLWHLGWKRMSQFQNQYSSWNLKWNHFVFWV